MPTTSQRKDSTARRRRPAARGLVRVEVQAPKDDVALIRGIAATLRSDPKKAEAIRASVRGLLGSAQAGTALDLFGSDLSDETFKGMFTTARGHGWRAVEL